MKYTPDLQGLYNKYRIVRNSDGRIIEDGFVLRPYDPHAQKALLVYADSVAAESPQLANDLRKMVEKAANSDLEDLLLPGWDWYQLGEHLGLYKEPPEIPPHLQHGEEIEVCDSDGDVVAVIVHEYDPGTPGCNYMPNGDPGYPGEPGHSYWRFRSVKP